tara:strand:+ start:33 stop:743 length:711 start_codon:yes stop_codon:yes gene_type:complete
MIFNKKKPIKVQYFINNDALDAEFAKSFFPNIQQYDSNSGTLCPSVQSINKRIYKVLSPLTVEIQVVNDKKEFIYKYNFDKKTFNANENNHTLLSKLLFTEITEKNFKHFQFFTPYTFITDDKDLEIMTMPYSTKINNMEFIGGAFKPYQWLRNINGSWKLLDESKNGDLHLFLNEPMFLIIFNKPIELEYIQPTKKIINYYNESKHIVSIRNNLKDIYKTVATRRPERLIIENNK